MPTAAATRISRSGSGGRGRGGRGGGRGGDRHLRSKSSATDPSEVKVAFGEVKEGVLIDLPEEPKYPRSQEPRLHCPLTMSENLKSLSEELTSYRSQVT